MKFFIFLEESIIGGVLQSLELVVFYQNRLPDLSRAAKGSYSVLWLLRD